MKWWQLPLLLWMIAGLAVCCETVPDVAGHAHPHDASHLDDPWHGLPADPHPDSGEKQSSDFHYHLTIDYSAIDSDIPIVRQLPTGHIGGLADRVEDDSPPEVPALDPEKPPLIRFRVA